MSVDVPIPGLKLISELNVREHWGARKRRASSQRDLVTLVLRRTVTSEMMLVQPLVVTITRIAPRRLDDDNAVGSAKHVRDAIAVLLGVNDGDPRVTWRVEQAKGPIAVRIAIHPARPNGATRLPQDELAGAASRLCPSRSPKAATGQPRGKRPSANVS